MNGNLALVSFVSGYQTHAEGEDESNAATSYFFCDVLKGPIFGCPRIVGTILNTTRHAGMMLNILFTVSKQEMFGLFDPHSTDFGHHVDPA